MKHLYFAILSPRLYYYYMYGARSGTTDTIKIIILLIEHVTLSLSGIVVYASLIGSLI